MLCVLSAAASEVPQTAGGNPTSQGTSEPERRAHQATRTGDRSKTPKTHKLPVPFETVAVLFTSPPHRTLALLYKATNSVPNHLTPALQSAAHEYYTGILLSQKHRNGVL